MSVNKAILIGNVGKEPDIKYFEPNHGVANFTLATTERAYADHNNRQFPERTEWHNIVVRGGLVQVVERFVHKGTKLYIEGKIRTRSYVDRQNQTRYVTEIVVDVLEILSRREAANDSQTDKNISNSTLGEPQRSNDKADDADLDFDSPF